MRLTPLERLARAVLLLHRGGMWTGTDRNEWVMLTGETDATNKVLCDLARRLLAEAQEPP
jgi:predicted NUDIX family NTP pyrophosphohydrolase